MKAKFEINFEVTSAFEFTKSHIFAVSIGNEVIGYVSKSRNKERITPLSLFKRVANNLHPLFDITAFTPEGLVSDAHCEACAAKILFEWHTGVNKKFVTSAASDGAEPEDYKVSVIEIDLKKILSENTDR